MYKRQGTDPVELTLLAERLSLNSIELSLNPNQFYYWKVITRDSEGNVSSSTVNGFKTSFLEVLPLYKFIDFSSPVWMNEKAISSHIIIHQITWFFSSEQNFPSTKSIRLKLLSLFLIPNLSLE